MCVVSGPVLNPGGTESSWSGRRDRLKGNHSQWCVKTGKPTGCTNTGGDLELGRSAPQWQETSAGGPERGGGPCPPGSSAWCFGYGRTSIDGGRIPRKINNFGMSFRSVCFPLRMWR